MKRTQDDIETYLKKFGVSQDIFDRLRVRQLEDLKTAQATKVEGYKKERERLALKYGSKHSRVQKLDKRLKHNDNIMRSIDMEIDSSSIQFPDFDKENSAMVSGRILDKDIKGIKGLTVSLCDKQGRWIDQTSYTGTDNSGFFSLVYDPAISEELYVAVSNSQKNILHLESEPIPLITGQVVPRFIIIPDLQAAYTPPATKKLKEEWGVEGIVIDEKNEPISGKEVRLYDTKGFCDKRVDSQNTDDNGKFKFVFKGKDFKDLIKADAEIYVKVCDSKGLVVYTSPYAVKCRAGGVDFYDLQLPPKKRRK